MNMCWLCEHPACVFVPINVRGEMSMKLKPVVLAIVAAGLVGPAFAAYGQGQRSASSASPISLDNFANPSKQRRKP